VIASRWSAPRCAEPPMPDLLAAVLLQLPADCIFTGLCGVKTAVTPVPSGVLFVAIGLVALGLFGLRARSSSR
jgi:hypothetical protein